MVETSGTRVHVVVIHERSCAAMLRAADRNATTREFFAKARGPGVTWKAGRPRRPI